MPVSTEAAMSDGEKVHAAPRIDPWRVGMLMIAGVVVVIALLRFSGGRTALETLMHVPLGTVLLMLAILYAAMTVRAWRWQVLLDAVGYRVGLGSLWSLLLTGYFLNTVVPARAGDLARIFLLGRWHKVPFETATGALVMERAIDVVVILVGAAGAAYMVLPALVPPVVAEGYLAAMLIMLALFVVLLGAPRLEGLLLGLWSNRRYQSLMGLAFSFLAAVRRMATDWRRLALAVGQTVLIWGAEVAVASLAMGALNIHLPLGQMTFCILTVDLSGAVPVLPGGLGQVEAVYLSLLLLLQAPKEAAGVAILLNRTVSFWSIMLVGGITTLLSGSLKRTEAPES